MSAITYSLVFPLPDDALGCMERVFSNRTLVIFCEVVISAFSCNPNASGAGLSGSYLMYSM
jgi:hypothetical protein